MKTQGKERKVSNNHNVHRIIAALLSGGVAVALVGCSSSGTDNSSGPSTVTIASTVTPTSSAPTSAAQSAPPATSPTVVAHEVRATGSADGIDVSITAPDPTTVRPGGAPMRFSVTLVNTTSAGVAKVGMVVSLGHCSCNPTGPGMMPAGSMSMLDADTNTWLAVPYVREATSTDFLAKTLVEPFVLEQGQTIKYQLEMSLAADQEFTVNHGESALNVTMTNVTTNTAVGVSPTASLPITVEP
jgi:hypothetical protein